MVTSHVLGRCTVTHCHSILVVETMQIKNLTLLRLTRHVGKFSQARLVVNGGTFAIT